MAPLAKYLNTSVILLLCVLSVAGQTKTINTTYTYDGKKYPLQMEVTDWKAVFKQNKTTTTPSSSSSAATSNYRVSGSLRRLQRSNERLRLSMQKTADKKKFIDEQLDEAFGLFEAGDYESAHALLQSKELLEGRHSNEKYPLLTFLTSAKLGMVNKAFLQYVVTFCYDDYDAAGKKIPGTSKSYIVDDPGTRTARYVQDRYTEKQMLEVELAFSELLLQKSKNEYYNAAFKNETALNHLNKTVAYFEKKGFNRTTDPSIILLYESCGDSVKSSQLFADIINTSSTPNGSKYQLCKYIINRAAPGSSLLRNAVANMKLLLGAAKDNDEKIITKLELVKGYYALGDNATAINHALDLVILLPQKSADYCAVTLLLAKIEGSQQQYTSAVTQYDYVLFFSTDAEMRKTAFSEKAMCYANAGDLKNALLTYQQLYKDYPDKFTANECAAFYIGNKEYPLAETLLDQTLKEDPSFYISMLNYGDLLVAKGKPKKAREYYVKASNQSGELTDVQLKVIEDYK